MLLEKEMKIPWGITTTWHKDNMRCLDVNTAGLPRAAFRSTNCLKVILFALL